MNKRIHACLDGEMGPERLSEEERLQLESLRGDMDALERHLRSQPAPDLTAAVMARVAAAAAPAPVRPRAPVWSRALHWLWSPQPVRLRPAYAFALALLLLVPWMYRVDGTAPPAQQTVAEGEPPVYVQFRLSAPGASRVELAGSFTGWQPAYEMRETGPGVWSVLVPLRPGVHDYAFVIDGETWVADPHAPSIADSFGGVNSRLSLPPLHNTA